MKLFLTSSGIPQEFAHMFLQSFNKPARDIKLYFVPTAANVEPDGQEWVTKSQNQFTQMGINPIWYNISYKTKEQMAFELQDADCIWVNGGNTFYLLDVVRTTGFDQVVTDLVLNKGVVYGGTSAGTYLACQSIEPTFWKAKFKNDIGTKDFSALNLTNFLTFVHYNEEKYKQAITKNFNTHSGQLYLIPDHGFLIVEDDRIGLINGVKMHE